MPNEDLALFCERLRIAMAERGIRQYELAEMTGIERPSINRYVKGLYMPKVGFLNKIAKALNVNPDWLVGFSNDMNLNDPGKTTTKMQLHAIIDSMDLDQLEKTLSFIETYIVKD